MTTYYLILTLMAPGMIPGHMQQAYPSQKACEAQIWPAVETWMNGNKNELGIVRDGTGIIARCSKTPRDAKKA